MKYCTMSTYTREFSDDFMQTYTREFSDNFMQIFYGLAGLAIDEGNRATKFPRLQGISVFIGLGHFSRTCSHVWTVYIQGYPQRMRLQRRPKRS